MHDAIFAQAFRPERFAVLGCSLLDYTLGHEIVLQRLRNPLVTGDERFDELPWSFKGESLMQAVLICCQRKPRVNWWWRQQCARLDIDSEVSRFRAYLLANCLDFPTVKQPRVHGCPYHYFGGPEIARLVNYVTAHHRLMIETHFEGSPLNFPFGLARCLQSAQLEADGHLWIANMHDVESQEQRNKFDELHPENTLAIGEDAVQNAAQKWNRAHPDCPVPLMRN
jgi:hypothetical protein